MNKDYSKFLTKPNTPNSTNNQSIHTLSIENRCDNITQSKQNTNNNNNNLNSFVPQYNFNPRIIPKKTSITKIRATDSYQEMNTSTFSSGSNSQKKRNKKISHSNYSNSSVDNYLNRRHMQELEKLKRMKIEREKKEREIYSFAPKISNKSKKIVNKILQKETSMQNSNIITTMMEEQNYPEQIPSNFYNDNNNYNYNENYNYNYDYNNYSNNKYRNNYNQNIDYNFYNNAQDQIRSNTFYNNSNPVSENNDIRRYQQFDYGDQNKLIATVSNYLNNNPQSIQTSDNFKLDNETREFALERLKALHQKITSNYN